MKRKSWVPFVVAAAILGASRAQAQEAGIDGSVTLPDGIVWVTNNDDPLIGSPDAIRGGPSITCWAHTHSPSA